MNTLKNYWPTAAEVDQCIRTEAETLGDPVLLAVHESAPLLVRSANASALEDATEGHLLAELMRPADDGSSVVVAITGDSGVGKSHMVRWLHAQLQRHPERDRLVIVLVPKTASLRQVVERILEPLEEERYAQLKSELSRVVETLRVDEAKQLLATSLAIELDRLYQQDMAKLRGDGQTDDRALRAHAEHAKGLSSLLRDPVVSEGWLYAVLKRIVTQTIRGGSEAETGEARRFTPQDLQVPEDWVSSEATRAANLYLQKIQSDDGAALPLAATLLQEALDPALRTVFRFSEALGQRSIEEIVDDIRRHLLEQGRELVLLIEDFAALAGIQQPLLNLIIAESDHQGRRIRAPLRTALAVTDGFLPSRQTILTRAKREWIIPNTAPTDDEIIDRLVGLTGRYLNAARWGIDALNHQYAQRKESDFHGWVGKFEDELDADESDQLAAFGTSSDGYPLFPFSRESIMAMARRELRQGTRLVYNPRAFINQVLRDVLVHRREFERGEFPPPRFKDAEMSIGAEMAVRAQPLSEGMRARLAPALVYWAGNPQGLASPPSVSKCVFDAFQLAWPFDASVPTKPVAEPKGRPEPRPSSIADAPVASVEATTRPATPQEGDIEIWAAGEQLSQRSAREIREIVAQGLAGRIDWNSLRMQRQQIQAGHIWLPFARVGNPSAEPRFDVGPEERPLAFHVKGGVLALCRWAANGRAWNYPRSEDDYAVAQILLDSLESQAIRHFTELANRRAEAALRTLHRQALLLRLTRKAKPAEPALEDYFAPMKALPEMVDPEDRSHEGTILKLIAEAGYALEDVRNVLLNAVTCFQGTGSTPLAVDRVRLQTAWLASSNESEDSSFLDQFDRAREVARTLGSNRLGVVVSRYLGVFERRFPTIRRLVGENPEINLVAPVKNLINEANRVGVQSSGNYSKAGIERALAFLASDLARSIFRRAISFNPPDPHRPIEFQLAACADFELTGLTTAVEALETLESFVELVQKAADSALRASGAGDVAGEMGSLRASLMAVVGEGGAP